VAGPAAFCHHLHACDPHQCGIVDASDNRSKFNVALGVEAQGFCVIK